MGVVLAHDLAHDRGALAIGRGGGEPHLAHREENAAMDRLEAVADVGQRSRHDDAHRVVEVAGLHLVLDTDGSDPAQIVGHGALFLRRPWPGPGAVSAAANSTAANTAIAATASRDVVVAPGRRGMATLIATPLP